MSIFKRNSKNTSAESLSKEDKIRPSRKIINKLRNRAYNIIEKNSGIEAILAKAKKNGALVEEIKPGEYQVTQKQEMMNGKLSNLNYNANEYYVKVVSKYRENSPTPNKPIDEIKYYNYMGVELPVVKRTMRNGDDIKLYILDRGTKLGIEFSGYDEKGNKVPNKEQTVRILGENNKTIQIYTGEDIENALLVPENNSTDRYSHTLLDVKNIISNTSISRRIVEWQANDGTKYLIQAGQQFKPESFSKIDKSISSQEFSDFASDTQCFIKNLKNYNEYAKLRNLKIEECSEKGKQVLKFKNSDNQVVRYIEAEANNQEIKNDIFYQLTKNGEIYQSATRDKDGNIISRTINEFRPWRGKASTVTLDYIKRKATTGLYLNGKLTNIKNVDFEYGEYLFRDIAGRSNRANH